MKIFVEGFLPFFIFGHFKNVQFLKSGESYVKKISTNYLLIILFVIFPKIVCVSSIQNFSVVVIMKLLVSIAFYYSGKDQSRLQYLYKLIDNFVENYKIETKINIETNSADITPIIIEKYFENVYNKQIKINVHNNFYMKHPFDLTRQHRKLFSKNLDKYDYFMYTEDDMLLPYNAFVEFTKKFEDLREYNYLPGLVRIEEKEGILHNTDNTEIHYVKKEDIIEINNRRYFKITNPYQGLWILPNDVIKNVIKEKKVVFINEKPNNYIREYMASFPFDDLKMTSIIELNENNKIHNNCYVYHLPNNYINRNNRGFGSLPIDNLVCVK